MRYEPRNIRTRPARFLDLEVGGSARLECFADGNPEPAFQWWHTVEDDGGDEQETSADEVQHISVIVLLSDILPYRI